MRALSRTAQRLQNLASHIVVNALGKPRRGKTKEPTVHASVEDRLCPFFNAGTNPPSDFGTQAYRRRASNRDVRRRRQSGIDPIEPGFGRVRDSVSTRRYV